MISGWLRSQPRECYRPAERCLCNLCNGPAYHKSHLLHCRWATGDETFELNYMNNNNIVNLLQCLHTTYTIQCEYLRVRLWTVLCTLMHSCLTRFNKIATPGAPQMAVDKEANSLSRVYSYYSKFNLHLFYV